MEGRNSLEVLGVGHRAGRSRFEELLRIADQRLALLLASSNDFLSEPPQLDSTLNSHPKFRQLRHKLEAYGEDVAEGKERMHRDKPRVWRQILYSSLQTLLAEVVVAEPRVQTKYLDRVFDWYYDKVNEVEASPVLSPMGKEERQVFIQKPPRLKPRRPEARGKRTRPSPLRKRFLHIIENTGLAALTDRAVARWAPLACLSVGEEKQTEVRLQHTLSQDHSAYRVATEMREKVQAWTTRQARKEEETTRRAEEAQLSCRRSRPFRSSSLSKSSIRSVTPVVDLSRTPLKALTPGLSDFLETDSPYFRQYEKVPRLRKLRGSLIEVQSSPKFKQVHHSLGAYTKPAAETDRPGPQTLSAERIQQLQEVAEAKQKLVKLGEVCAYAKLATALLVPEDLPLAKLTPESLPKDGARLMRNPFLWLHGKPKKRRRRRY